MTGVTAILAGMGASPPVVGQQVYTTAGTYSWVAPAGVTKVSVLVVGGGASSGGGGALRYMNNYTVTPGSSYTVVVGAGSARGTNVNGGQSYFVNTTLLRANGGNICAVLSTGVGGCGGGRGGYLVPNGGGGAAGYSGDGGNGFAAGAGGGGGGGSTRGGGGGVGLYGQGSSGAAGSGETTQAGGFGGSGGSRGGAATGPCFSEAGNGGAHGGGGGSASGAGRGGGGVGAVRIIWPGNTRLFPSTCVGNF